MYKKNAAPVGLERSILAVNKLFLATNVNIKGSELYLRLYNSSFPANKILSPQRTYKPTGFKDVARYCLAEITVTQLRPGQK